MVLNAPIKQQHWLIIMVAKNKNYVHRFRRNVYKFTLVLLHAATYDSHRPKSDKIMRYNI